MSQSIKGSALEAVTSTVIGWYVALATQLLVFPVFGIHVAFNTNLLISVIFTVVSIIRGFLVRRLFNSLGE